MTPETNHRQPLRPPRPAEPGEAIREIKVLAIDLGTWSSVATLFENQEGIGFDPGQEQALRSGLAALLRDETLKPVADLVFKEYEDLRVFTAEDERPDPVGDLEELSASLADRPISAVTDRDALAERRAAELALERTLMHPRHAGLRDKIVPRLHRLHDSVFDVLPLRLQNLWILPIHDQLQGDEVSSLLAVYPDRFADSRLLSSRADAFDSDGVIYPGIKRRMVRRQQVAELAGQDLPEGWQPDSDLLIGQSYRNLVQRVEEQVLAADPQVGWPELTGTAGAIANRVVVTFPTTLVPTARARLRAIVADALGLGRPQYVRMDYDEAVSSALFFVLKGISGNRNAGIEAFQARARLVPGRPYPTWRQNVLVIDVGGGTTDIALLKVELTDETPTPPAREGDEPEVTGRTFVLRPQVLGTTGHPQLGGDLLTLRMFYWLKAAIADAIGAAGPGSPGPAPGFAARVIKSRNREPVPPSVRQALRDLVPTHAEGSGQGPRPAHPTVRPLSKSSAAFETLWVEMENAKSTEVAADDPRYQLREDLARELPADVPWAADLAAVDCATVRLSHDDFGRLIRPIITAVAGLAAGLVRRLLGDDPGQRLDAVALCGRTTGMPEVRKIVMEVLGRELGGTAGGRRPIEWDPAGVTVEPTYSKHAASIGACWAHAKATVTELEDGDTDAGVHVLRVKPNDLTPALPADFGLAGTDPESTAVPWLRAGQPFDMADQTGRRPAVLFTRSQWRPLDQLLCLHRLLPAPVMDKFKSLEWATYNHTIARDKAGAPGCPPGTQTWFQIEMNQELEPWVWLCTGTPGQVQPVLHPDDGLDLTSRARIRLRNYQELMDCFSDGMLREMPLIEVAAGADDDPVPIFSPGPVDQMFTYFVATDGQVPDLGRPAGDLMPAWVSQRPLPAPPYGSTGPVRFYVTVNGSRLPEPIDPPAFSSDLPVPGAPYWALLDADGDLRIMAGYPPYLTARDMTEMTVTLGLPFLVPMVDGIPDWEPSWDPFTGDH